jgi:hypothetical protein
MNSVEKLLCGSHRQDEMRREIKEVLSILQSEFSQSSTCGKWQFPRGPHHQYWWSVYIFFADSPTPMATEFRLLERDSPEQEMFACTVYKGITKVTVPLDKINTPIVHGCLALLVDEIRDRFSYIRKSLEPIMDLAADSRKTKK